MVKSSSLQFRDRVVVYARRFSSVAILALLAAAFSAAASSSLAARAAAQATPRAQEKSAPLVQDAPQSEEMRKNLPDFGEVTPKLYRGAQPSSEGFHMLAQMGINIVIDLRGSNKKERELVTSLGMRYVAMGWECSFPKDKTFAKFLTLLRGNPDKKVFVHCRVGDDRTAMMVAAYRMAFEGWSAKRARVEMEKYGFSFLHRNLICLRLASYEKSFPRRLKTSPAFKRLRESDPNP